MRIVFIGYNYLPEYTSPKQWISRIRPSAIIMESLGRHHTVSYVGQIGYSGNYFSKGVLYHFLDPGKKQRFPRQLHSIVKQLKPDVIVVPGFHFPLQVIQLRLSLGKKVKIILEYHADKPFHGLKKRLQQLADRSVNAYFFTSLGNAEEWLDAKIIRDINKCYEIPANTSYFLRLSKEISRQETKMNAAVNFLWVGRLDKNKDPVTVIKAFAEFHSQHPSSSLHMIYDTAELLEELKEIINKHPQLQESIIFHGHIPHNELAIWYSAADFFISGSHREGGSIALVEAMSCGCIPIVTNIPSAMKVIENGQYGFYYEAGNKDDLLKQLLMSMTIDKQKLSEAIEEYFYQQLSSDAIAKRFAMLCTKLIAE